MAKKSPRKAAKKTNAARKTSKPRKAPQAAPEPRQPAKKKKGVPKTAAFLAAFRLTASVTRAAKAAGIQRCLHYRWLEEDPAYAAAFEKAKDEAAQVLEDEAIRRATEGVKKPIFYKGERVAYVQEYSDRLLEFLLKGWKPDKFKDRFQGEVTGTVDLVERLAAARKRVKRP